MKQREIKFRAWIPSIKKMGMAWDMHKELTTVMDSTHDVFPYEAIFMQFTGLLDKNGKEIYEGDILKNNGIVEWYVSPDEEFDGWTIKDFGWGRRHHMGWLTTPLEVIGNIYENGELLKS